MARFKIDENRFMTKRYPLYVIRADDTALLTGAGGHYIELPDQTGENAMPRLTFEKNSGGTVKLYQQDIDKLAITGADFLLLGKRVPKFLGNLLALFDSIGWQSVFRCPRTGYHLRMIVEKMEGDRILCWVPQKVYYCILDRNFLKAT